MATTSQQTTVVFPSLEWFKALRDAMNRQRDKYRRAGWMDMALAVRILPDGAVKQEHVYGIVFDADECVEVRPLKSPKDIGAECAVEGPYSAWKEMIENIQAHGGADRRHTINSLTVLKKPLWITGDDQVGMDKLFRFNYSLQMFFDEAASFKTRFL